MARATFAAWALAIILMPAAAFAQCANPEGKHVHVYMMRGLLGGGSLGLDALATKLTTRGIHTTVRSWRDHSDVAVEASMVNAPVVIIGHSLGGNRAVSAASAIKRPVALLVLFDPVPEPGEIPSNVKSVLRFDANGWFEHVRIDDDERLHAKVIKKICGLLQ